jgi:hypothetical protein
MLVNIPYMEHIIMKQNKTLSAFVFVKGDPTKSLKACATHLRTTPVAFGRTTFSPQRKTRISATLRYTSVGEV